MVTTMTGTMTTDDSDKTVWFLYTQTRDSANTQLQFSIFPKDRPKRIYTLEVFGRRLERTLPQMSHSHRTISFWWSCWLSGLMEARNEM